MNILNKAVVTNLHIYKPEIFKDQILLGYDCKETGNVRPYTTDRCTEYELAVKVGVTFWANKAQYNDALQHAEKLLLQRLHSDILGEVAELNTAIYSHDAEAALCSIARIKRSIGL